MTMTMIVATLTAVGLSAVPVLLLCIGDPKRRRSIRKAGNGMEPGQRRLLAAMACMPGLGCIFYGAAAAFLMWFGGCALIGWGSTLCVGAMAHPDR